MLAVVLIHANWFFFGKRYANPDGTIEWTIEALANIVTRFSVPCFVMISGAFNLRKETDAIDFYKKSVQKIFLPTTGIVVLFAVFRIITNKLLSRSLLYGMKGLVTGSFYNMWFLYMLAILYLLTPALTLVKKNCSEKQYKTIVAVWAIWAVISQATSDQKLAYSIGVGVAYVSYYLLGDIIATEIRKGKQKKKYLLALLSAMCIVIAYFWRKTGHNYYISKAYINFFSPTTMILSICVFYYFGSLTIKKNFTWMSGKSFYMYLFHTVILQALERLIIGKTTEIPGILILTVLTSIFSLIAAIVFDKVWKRIDKAVKPRVYGSKVWKFLG